MAFPFPPGLNAANFPAGTFTTPNRVVLIGRGRYEESSVSNLNGNGVQILPGMLLEDDGFGSFRPHNSVWGRHEKMFALEQGLQGIGGATTPVGAWDAYPVGSACQTYTAGLGDVVQALLQLGQNVTENEALGSAGDGTLIGSATVLTTTTTTSTTTTTTTSTTSTTTTSTTTTSTTQTPGIPAAGSYSVGIALSAVNNSVGTTGFSYSPSALVIVRIIAV